MIFGDVERFAFGVRWESWSRFRVRRVDWPDGISNIILSLWRLRLIVWRRRA